MNDYLTQTVNAILESVSFDSSLSEPLPDMPFGKGTADCLAHFLTLAERLGFQTKNYDNYVGEVVFGEGEPFAVLAHLDVVPAGQGWNTPPFEGVLKEGKIFGRGTMDDKGPAICALFAMKALKDEGFTPNRQIKLIVGCNEESGWACIDHYKKVATLPDEGFSPDANFPVIYAEKGIAHVKLRFPVKNPPFLALRGGERANMVCDFCEAIPVTPNETRAIQHGLTLKEGKLLSYGKSAHGSTPEDGVNAIEPILRYFENCPSVQKVLSCLFDDCEGLKTLRDETGALTLSPDVISYEISTSTIEVLCDIRYPATLDFSTVTEKLDHFQAPYEVISYQAPLYHDKKSKLISTLCEVYNEYAGKDERPVAIGGGTYARALKMGVAFGPEVEGEEVTIHQANEYITIERVELMLNVYKKALERLTK